MRCKICQEDFKQLGFEEWGMCSDCCLQMVKNAETIEALKEKPEPVGKPLGNLVGGLAAVFYSLAVTTAGISVAAQALKESGVIDKEVADGNK